MNEMQRLAEASDPERFSLRKQRIQVTGLALWFAAVIFPLWTLDYSRRGQFVEASAFFWHYSAAVILLTGMYFAIFRPYAVQRVAASFFTDIISTLFISFGIFTIVISLLTGRGGAAAYGAIFLLTYALWADFWQMSVAAQRVFVILTFYVLALFLIGAVAIHGWPQFRWIGGIHPNLYGAAALALIAVARLCGGRLYRLGVVLAFGATILVSSRYALLSCFAFVFITYALPLIRARDGGLRILLFSLSVGIIVGAVFAIEPLWGIFDRLFALSSVERGIGSRLGGRMDSWDNFLFQFLREPILGYGFRQRHEYFGTHNAYLNTILESGLIAGFLIGGAVLAGGRMLKASLTSDKRWCRDSADRDRKEYVSDYGFAIFVAVAISGFFQPQMINFGDPFGILVLLMLGLNSYPNDSHMVRAVGLARSDQHK